MQDLFARVTSEVPFVGKLGAEGKALFHAHMTHIKFAENKLLLAGDDQCNHVFFVLEGTFRVFKMSEEGREVTLYRLGPGDTCLFTVSCLVDLGELDASVEIEAGAEVVSLPADVFQLMLDNNPTLHRYLMQKTFVRLNQVMRVVERVTFASLKRRVAFYLREARVKQGSAKLRLTKEHIALEVGTAREVVSRVLGALEDEGVVALGRGKVHLLNEKFLADLHVQ